MAMCLHSNIANISILKQIIKSSTSQLEINPVLGKSIAIIYSKRLRENFPNQDLQLRA